MTKKSKSKTPKKKVTKPKKEKTPATSTNGVKDHVKNHWTLALLDL